MSKEKTYYEVIGRNKVSLIPINVTGEVRVGAYIIGNYVTDEDNNLIGYDCHVSDEPEIWLCWKVMAVEGDDIVVRPYHDSQANCFTRREVWTFADGHEFLPCGHVQGWCTCP